MQECHHYRAYLGLAGRYLSRYNFVPPAQCHFPPKNPYLTFVTADARIVLQLHPSLQQSRPFQYHRHRQLVSTRCRGGKPIRSLQSSLSIYLFGIYSSSINPSRTFPPRLGGSLPWRIIRPGFNLGFAAKTETSKGDVATESNRITSSKKKNISLQRKIKEGNRSGNRKAYVNEGLVLVDWI